jgi:hypothetical protein
MRDHMLRPPCDPLLDVFGPKCPQCGGPTYVSIVSAVVLCVSEICAWTYRPTTMALLGASTRPGNPTRRLLDAGRRFDDLDDDDECSLRD